MDIVQIIEQAFKSVLETFDINNDVEENVKMLKEHVINEVADCSDEIRCKYKIDLMLDNVIDVINDNLDDTTTEDKSYTIDIFTLSLEKIIESINKNQK